MESKPILTLESELVLIPLEITYAINFLKNGGSTASLREQLGHRTIETVEKYLYWSSEDKLEEFQKYSPLDNMGF